MKTFVLAASLLFLTGCEERVKPSYDGAVEIKYPTQSLAVIKIKEGGKTYLVLRSKISSGECMVKLDEFVEAKP